MRESQEFPGSVEGTMKFDKDTCCALERAFEKNPIIVEQLESIVGKAETDFFAEALSKMADDEIMIMSDEMKTVYSQIAKRELERIDAEDESDDDLYCGHSVDEHYQALTFVLKTVEPSIN